MQARATGHPLPLVPDRELPTEGWGVRTLRELIERVVREEVVAAPTGRGVVHVLTEQERAGADVSVALALQAFEDRLYLVLLDGRQQRKLDAPVLVSPDSTVTFLRLLS